MNEAQQQIAIEEACGWTCDRQGNWMDINKKYGIRGLPPDYPNDLNAMHEAEKFIPRSKWTRYCQYLAELGCGSVRFVSVHATASHRAEAFLRTIGKWEE